MMYMADITFGLFTAMDSGLTPSYYALTNINGEATIMIPVTKEFISNAGGELIYYMREIAPAVANRVVGMNYDESWMYAIRITWSDEENQAVVEYASIEDGRIGAYTVYTNGSFTFEQTNTFPSNVSVDIDLTGNKTLNGGNDLGGRKFSFSLYKSTAAFVQGELIKTVTNNGNAISFSDISFTAPGVYYMVAKEDASNLGGITYDDSRYHITVVVEDDGIGNLIPTVTVAGSNVTVTADADNSRLVTVDGLDFTNGYQAKPAQYTPEAQKLYEHDETEEMKEFDFILTVDGSDKQTKQNDPNGKVIFDTLEFNTAGVYELTIREQRNILWGLIRWDVNVYTITLHVEDNGAGQLFVNENNTVITSEKGSDDLVFHNAHYDVITKKDVFTVSEPTVSIDGKVVEINDTLLYKIFYTNFDSVPVDIEITDAIPQYTTYVDGSADNDGIYKDGVITWNLQLAAGESKTVSFQVKVVDTKITVINQATALEGENKLESNQVTNPVKEDKVTNLVPPSVETPQNGDNSNIGLWLVLLIVSATGIVTLSVEQKKRTAMK